MKSFAVEIKLRIKVRADNPGDAASKTADKFTGFIRAYAPPLFRGSEIEAVAFPARIDDG